MNVLAEPYTVEQLKKLTDGNQDNYVTGIVRVSMDDLMTELDIALNTLSYKLVGNDRLLETSYKAVGAQDGDVLVEVKGDVSLILDSAGP